MKDKPTDILMWFYIMLFNLNVAGKMPCLVHVWNNDWLENITELSFQPVTISLTTKYYIFSYLVGNSTKLCLWRTNLYQYVLSTEALEHI